jgi:hypothetical protein
MKKLKFWLVTGLVTVFVFQMWAQEVPPDKRTVWISAQKDFLVISGDISVLKGATALNVSVSPEIQKMGTKYQPDSVFIANRVKEYNDSKPGKGDIWLNDWNREKNNFAPAFVEGFNKIFAKSVIKAVSKDASAEYTFIIYTKHLMEYWGSVYVILDGDIVKTNDPVTKVASIRFPVLYSAKKGKQYKEKYECAYYTAGLYFGKFYKKKVHK